MKNLNNYIVSFLPLLLTLVFLSCDGNVIKMLNKEVSSADNVKIYFYDKTSGKMPNSGSVVSINDREEVEHLLSTITEENFAKRPDCAYNGLIEFFNGSISLKNMEFNMEQNCGFVIFQIKYVIESKKLSYQVILLLNFYYAKISN